MSPQELEFIMKMRDEASAILSKMGAAFRQAGKGADELGNNTDKAGTKIDNLVKHAKEAAASMTGFYTSMRALQGASGSWNDYELGMVNVAKTTNMAGKEMEDFRVKFDALNRNMNGVSTASLQELAATVGQLGVKGADNINSMVEVLGKLEIATDVAGAEGASSIARILTLTKEGPAGIKEFGDALSHLGNNTAAFESELVHMATWLAQSTTEFQISSKHLLALSAGMRQLGVNYEIFGTTSGRVLRGLRDGMINNTTGFQEFLKQTKMTREEFNALIQEKPEEVLLKFGEAYQKVATEGKSKTFLQKLGLDNDEMRRVFGAMGSSMDVMREKMALIEGPDLKGALDREVKPFFEANKNELQALGKAWLGIKVVIGEALAPLTQPIINNAAIAFNYVADTIRSLPPVVKQVVAGFLVLGPAIAAAGVAIKTLSVAVGALGIGTAFTVAIGAVRKFAAAMVIVFNLMGGWTAITAMFSGLTSAIATAAAAVAAFITWPVALGAAFVAAGALVYAYWDDIKKFFSQSWTDMAKAIKTAVVRGFDSAIDDLKKRWDDFMFYMANGQTRGEASAAAGAAIGALAGKPGASGKTDRPGKTVNPALSAPISDDDYEALKSLNDQIKAMEELKKQETALNNIRSAGLDAVKKKNENIRQEDIDRAQRLFDVQKKQLEDPLHTTIRGIQDEADAAEAVTAERKNQLEIAKKIRDEMEATGLSEAQVAPRITAAMQKLQKANQDKAYREQLQTAKDSLAVAQAATEAERQRLGIVQSIAQFERENGKLADGGKELASIMSDEQQANAFRTLRDSLDPVQAATTQYAEDMDVLNKALADGTIKIEQYNKMVSALQRTTLADRDPFADQIKSIQEQIHLAKISGEYKDADVSTQQTINQLADRNIFLTQQQVAELTEYNRQLQEVKKAQSSGLNGWMDSVGTLRDNMLDITKDFATSLSDAISGAIAGEESSFADFFKNMGKKFISAGVNQMMKGLFQNLQNQSGSGGMWGSIASFLGLSKGEGIKQPDMLKNLTAANMNVQAASVVIGGAGLNLAAGTGVGGGLAAANNNGGVAAINRMLSGGSGIDLSKFAVGNANMSGVSDALNQRFSAMLAAAPASVRGDVSIYSAYRSNERQAQLWQDALAKYGSPEAARKWVAPPGSSNHNYGNAFDLKYGSDTTKQWFHDNAGQYGLQYPMKNEDWHIEPVSDMGGRLKAGQMATANVPAVDTSAVTNSITQVNQSMNQMGTNIQQVSANAQTAASNFTASGANIQQAGVATQQAGVAAQQSGQQFDAAGTQIQGAGQKAAQGGQAASTASSNLGSFTGAVTKSGEGAAQATGGIGGFFSSLMSGVQSLLSGIMGGSGGGFSSIFSLIGSIFGLKDGGQAQSGSGKVSGPGTSRSDSVLYWLSDGEFVMNAASTKKYLPMLQAMNDNAIPKLKDGGLATSRRIDSSSLSMGAAAMTSSGSRGGQTVNRTVNTFSPTIPITVQASGNTETDAKLTERLSSEMDTLLENKMIEFTQNQQRTGNMLSKKRFI